MVTDFIYDGFRLSDFGYVIVSFDGSKGGEIDTDSQLSFNHAPMMSGKRQPYITSVYEDPLKMEIQISKNICINGVQDVSKSSYTITLDDMAFLKRWLTRPHPHKLSVVGDEYIGIYWMGSFNVSEYIFGDGRIGATLEFECDAPFGYKEDVILRGDLSANESFEYTCSSDEIGWIYPNLTITIKEDGDLQINNSDNRITVINNCQANEVITIDKNLQIASTLDSHKIADDFNYVFYRVNNSFNSVVNTLTSNLPISYEIRYSPYAKVVIV